MTHEDWRKRCENAKGGPKQPYDENEPDEDGCDHEFELDDDTGEYSCHCGERYRPDLTELM